MQEDCPPASFLGRLGTGRGGDPGDPDALCCEAVLASGALRGWSSLARRSIRPRILRGRAEGASIDAC